MIRRPPRSTQSRSSAASDVYKRQNKSRSLLDLPGVTLCGGLVAGHARYLIRVLEIDLTPGDINGDVYEHNAVPAGRGKEESLLDHPWYLHRVFNQVVMLGNGKRDARRVRFLERLSLI